ncbi:MAG: hypothetical protein MHMPM18_000884 [Marteilia pararefringens]
MLHSLTLCILFGLVVPTHSPSICQTSTNTPHVASSGRLTAQKLLEICKYCGKIIQFEPNMNRDEMQNEDYSDYEVVNPDHSKCANFTEYLIKTYSSNSDNLEMLQNCSSVCTDTDQYKFIFIKSQNGLEGLFNYFTDMISKPIPTNIDLGEGLYRLKDPDDAKRLSYFKVKMERRGNETCRDVIGRSLVKINILRFTQPKEIQSSTDKAKERFLGRLPCFNVFQSTESKEELLSRQTVSFEHMADLCQVNLIIYFGESKHCSDVGSLDKYQAAQCLRRAVKLDKNLYDRESFEKKYRDSAGIKASETLSQYKALYFKARGQQATIKDKCAEIYHFEGSKSSGGSGPNKTITIAKKKRESRYNLENTGHEDVAITQENSARRTGTSSNDSDPAYQDVPGQNSAGHTGTNPDDSDSNDSYYSDGSFDGSFDD